MTYREDFTLPAELLEQVKEQGLDVLPELIRVILNTAMQVEREQFMNAEPYQRTIEREAHANGFKPKTMRTRVGEITFSIPQVREGGFYPQALEKGLRSERALTLALAEMYVQGVSTRKVRAITEQLCGHIRVLGDGQPGGSPDGYRVGEVAGTTLGRIPILVPGCLLRTSS